MNRNHISDEILIAWIERSLSKSEYRKVSNHLEDCDECYLRYSTLLESVTAGKSAKPEEVPSEIKQYAKEQLGVINTITPQQSVKISILDKLRQLPILRPIPITAALASVALLLVILNLPVDITKPNAFITTSKEISPVSVKIENDSLIISQSIKVNNSIFISSVDGDTLLNMEFSELKAIYPLREFERYEEIQVLVKSHSVSLVDTVLTL